MQRTMVRVTRFGLVILLGLGLAACGSNRDSDNEVTAELDPSVEAAARKECLACHASLEMLEAKVDAARAEGLVVEEELMGTHGRLACQRCHTEAEEAFNDWHPAIVTNPTADGGDVCATCHGTKMVENFKASIHFTLSGIANGVCKRLKPLADVDPEAAQEAFEGYFNGEEGCMACHATCGSCHVASPVIQETDEGGLMEGHRFMKKPESEESCMKCHWENGESWEAMDAHALKGMECTSCHTAIEEVHGRDTSEMEVGPLYYKGPSSTLPGGAVGPRDPSLSTVIKTSCEDCHNNAAVHDNNSVITDHYQSLDCFACHTQPYYNCYGCHANDGSPGNYEEYVKLGLTVKGDPTSKLGLLTHIGSAFDMIEGYTIPATNADPDWKSAWAASSAMHLIAAKPLVNDKAKASESMCDNCHNGGADIFLKESDIDAGGADPVDDLNWVVPTDRLPSF